MPITHKEKKNKEEKTEEVAVVAKKKNGKVFFRSDSVWCCHSEISNRHSSFNPCCCL